MDDPLEYEYYHELCRVCLQRDDGNEETKAGLKVLLKKYLSVDVEKEEGFFPKKLCKKCTAVLEEFHSLRLTVENTTAVLNASLVSNNAFEIEELEIDADSLKSNEGSVSVQRINKKEDDVNLKVTEIDIKEDAQLSDLEPTQNVEENKKSSFECERKELSRFQLSSCNNSFRRRAHLKEHLTEKHGDENIVQNTRSYERHKQVRHSSETTDALQYGKDVKEEEDTDRSSSDEDDSWFSPPSVKALEGNLYCSQCARSFRKEENFASHMRTHRGLKPFQCPHCELCYNSRGALNLHITEKHTVQPVYECEFTGCGKKFKGNKSLSRHIRKVHKKRSINRAKPITKNFVCEECGSAYPGRRALYLHQFTHRPKEERPFGCKECDKRFLTDRCLQQHLLRHAGIKNFECPHCGVKKTTKVELDTHVNYHTQEKKWQCKWCNSVFFSAGGLKQHERVVHRGIRAFKCQYCELSFGKKGTLTNHERRHTGEKPHQCEICERRFIQLVNLQAHLKTHSKQK